MPTRSLVLGRRPNKALFKIVGFGPDSFSLLVWAESAHYSDSIDDYSGE